MESNNLGVYFSEKEKGFVFTKTGEVILSTYRHRYEYEIIEHKYGYCSIVLYYDPSAPGKDNDWIFESRLVHKEKGVIDIQSMIEGYDVNDGTHLKFLNCGIISYKNNFYDVDFKFLFRLPNMIRPFSDFDPNIGIAEFFRYYQLLIKIVNGELYCIVDVTGVDFTNLNEENDCHNTPYLDKQGKDMGGTQVYLGDYAAYPTNYGQYLSYDKNSIWKTLCITDELGEKICGNGMILDFNNYFYLFKDEVRIPKSFLPEYTKKVYSIYGDILFDEKTIFEDLEYENLIDIKIQNNRMFWVVSQSSKITNREFVYRLFNHKGVCLYTGLYSFVENFSCNMAFFRKLKGNECLYGFLKYRDSKIYEIYMDEQIQFSEPFTSPIFKNGFVYISGAYYDLELNKVGKRNSELTYTSRTEESSYRNNGLKSTNSYIYYQGEKINLGIDVCIEKEISSGLFLAQYAACGQFDTKGNILFEPKMKFPFVNKKVDMEKLNDVYLSRYFLKKNLKYGAILVDRLR